ncbi:MAG: exodeoxyribonuclease VII small subunit [Acholeplasmatales bacterium]|jgi:exodeoxyribonuclease VII small subunit|nr:exodeoxyribonuclease VII small subunit [Acholeplasmatales bacterium]
MEKSFEELLRDLEKIVKDLENKELPLEESIKKYKAGLELSNKLTAALTSAKELVIKEV